VEHLLVVRHGLAGSNRDATASCSIPGEGLTSEGVEQARALAHVLTEEEIDVALTSRFARTQQTLALALDGRDVPVVVSAELDEIHFGSFDGGLLETYRAWAASTPPDEPPPGEGESRAQAAARFARGLRLVLERPETHVLVVGHALAIRYWLDAAEDLVPAARMAPVDHAWPYRLSRAEIEHAAGLLENWSRSACFRDPSKEG
jgi:broad specificity phosphatase PhoE